MTIHTKDLQRALAKAKFYKGKIDGDFGPKSRAARNSLLMTIDERSERWPESRKQLALQQWVMSEVEIETGVIDGLMGPQTAYALECWVSYLRDRDVPAADIKHQPDVFPRQRDMEKFYGKPGTNHVLLDLPYPMRLAWDKSVTVERMTINKACAESAGRAFKKILDHYGYDEIRRLGLDLFGGCYNNRKMRGGSSLSTHAYAAAIDIDPARNRFRWGADRAKLDNPEYAAFLDIWESEGWISLGREMNRDWMHVQAARL